MKITRESLGAALAGAAPILFALEGNPSTIGKIAAAVVAVLVAVGLLHRPAPGSK